MRIKSESFIKIFGTFACSLFITATSTYIYSPVAPSDAGSYMASETAGLYTLSLITDPEVNIDATPTGTQAVYSTTSTISFMSDCPAGATITMNMAADSNLLNGELSSISATTHSPLDDNSWGLSLDDGDTWQGVPIASSTPIVVYNTDTSEPHLLSIPLLFGIKIDNNLPSGNYINDVVYTLIPDTGCYTYSVTWDADSGINPDDLPEAVNLDGTLNLSVLSRPTRDYYDFTGWTNGTDTFTGDETDANINPDNSPNVVMRALWSPTPYSIAYNLNGGTVSTANPTTYNIESDPFTLSNPTKNGYTFAGWSGTDLSSPSTSVSVPTGSHDERTYTANWTPVNYAISYNLNGGSVSPANPTSYNIETASFTLRNPTRSGYNFTGWSGTGLSGSANKTVTIAQGSTGARSYTANWVSACTFASKDFSYTGGVQSFTVPCDGTYKLEVYGAQGGNTAVYANSYSGKGGAGGYAKGNVTLNKGAVLYVVVGGQGSATPTSGAGGGTNGGYNGGGGVSNWNGDSSFVAGGGGCTHISTVNGVLSTTKSALIIAGGGGGGHIQLDTFWEPHNGGTGGGSATGVNAGSSTGYAWGASSNGVGGNSYQGGGGGCGWPGGAGAAYGAGGGGAGYIGGVTGGSMSNGQRSGNGYAKITRV